MYYTLATLLRLRQNHHPMAHRGNRLLAWLHSGRKVRGEKSVYGLGIDELSDALLVSAREEYEVVGFECEVRGRPGEGLLELWCFGHVVI